MNKATAFLGGVLFLVECIVKERTEGRQARGYNDHIGLDSGVVILYQRLHRRKARGQSPKMVTSLHCPDDETSRAVGKVGVITQCRQLGGFDDGTDSCEECAAHQNAEANF